LGGSQRHAAAVGAHLYPPATHHLAPSLQLGGEREMGGGERGRGKGEKRKTERRERKTKDVTVAIKL